MLSLERQELLAIIYLLAYGLLAMGVDVWGFVELKICLAVLLVIGIGYFISKEQEDACIPLVCLLVLLMLEHFDGSRGALFLCGAGSVLLHAFLILLLVALDILERIIRFVKKGKKKGEINYG